MILASLARYKSSTSSKKPPAFNCILTEAEHRYRSGDCIKTWKLAPSHHDRALSVSFSLMTFVTHDLHDTSLWIFRYLSESVYTISPCFFQFFNIWRT